MGFNTESEMSAYFKELLSENLNYSNIEIIEEFSGLFGIPDYILVEKTDNSLDYVIAFELKLKNWNRALLQAFKYRTFSYESYVVIDEERVNNALKHKEEFIRYNIGLASLNYRKELKIYYFPQSNRPFSEFFMRKMKNKILGQSDKKEFDENESNTVLQKEFFSFAIDLA